jgi:hypothetical protein
MPLAGERQPRSALVVAGRSAGAALRGTTPRGVARICAAAQGEPPNIINNAKSKTWAARDMIGLLAEKLPEQQGGSIGNRTRGFKTFY